MFEKYSASGNDFLITHLPMPLPRPTLAKMLCNRFEGIGADGMVFIDSHRFLAYQWDFYNSDGSSASMCGNASRCVGLYAFLHHLAPRNHSFLTPAGEIQIQVLQATYPYSVQSHLGEYKVLPNAPEHWGFFDTGVPHLIYLAKNLSEFESFPLEEMRRLRQIYNANVNLALSCPEGYKIKTYERGVEAITLACGTGMASVVAYLNENNLHSNTMTLIPPSGEKLQFSLQNKSISFQGEVKKIAKCDIYFQDYGVQQ